MATPLPTESDVMNALRGVIDPELGRNIVELKMAQSAAVEADGHVVVTIALTTPGCPLRTPRFSATPKLESPLPGVTSVALNWEVMSSEQKSQTMDILRRRAAEEATDTAIPTTTRVLAIASGKGGVGKSSVTANLAAALANRGETSA
ncbi:MAG: iron-sulfur cluster assembly protein [Acidimicrobiales bacterium]